MTVNAAVHESVFGTPDVYWISSGAASRGEDYQIAKLLAGGVSVAEAAGPTNTEKRTHAAGFWIIKFPSSSTLSPVFLASSNTEGCQSTLPASGPPTIAISSASGASVRLLKPR